MNMLVTSNQRLCGFNLIVIYLIVLVTLVLINIIVHLHCHIENPSIVIAAVFYLRVKMTLPECYSFMK